MEALLYTRVSKEDQVKFGMSLDAQLESLKQYCSENNLKIRNIYSDEGISGGSITKRKAFQSMIEEAKPGDIILFTKLDRFSRNLLDANIVVKELTKKDVSIKAINEDDIDTSTADGKFIFNLKLSLAQREREKVSERINDVFAYKIKQGEIVSGQIPYGYMKKNKHLVLDPVKSVWMREMFEHYLKYQSLVGTCKWWNEQHPDETIGYTAFKNSRISNPIYCGKHPSGLNDNFCDPIISVEQFDKVQELLSRNIKSIRTNHVYLFTGLMTCSHCGRRMAGFYRKWKDNKLNYYRCYNHTQNGICDRLCHNKQLINSHFYRGVSELPYKLLFAVIYTHLEFRYEVSHTITSHHVHHFHQTRIPDGTLLDYMVQYRKPLFPQFFLYPKKFLPENNPHHKEFHLRPYIQNNANQ